MPWSDELLIGTPTYSIASSENRRIRVIAGPGTGKSFAMKRRVARLLETEVDAERILPVTFTRVAAEDLHRELNMEVPGCNNLEGVTLHRLALKILLGNNVLDVTGRVPRPLNEFELEPLICDLKERHGGRTNVKRLIKAYEAAWARLQHEQPGYAISEEDEAFQIDLLQWLQFHEAMLIGEVIPELHRYLFANPNAPERSAYSHIMVDEFQDLNRAEQGVIRLLSDAADVCVVGDDDQSIYSFKHAHPEGIQEWIDANADAADFSLNQCRRCPTLVVEMANSLISNNQLRPIQRALVPIPENGEGRVRILQYRDKSNEVSGVAEHVTQMIREGTSAGDILILTQSKVFGEPIYEALLEMGVPAKSYYSETELSDTDAQRAFALLKLLVNHEDRVALRWLVGIDGHNYHAAGYRRVREYCDEFGLSPWEALQSLNNGEHRLPYTNGIVVAFREICQEIEDLESLPDLATVIDHLFPDGQDSTQDIRSLALQVYEELGGEDCEAFVQELLDLIVHPEIPTEVQDVRIMSLHKSKGLSSPVTIIAGCVQRLLPRLPAENFTPEQCRQYLEEQRRLFYVGVTRVKADPDEEKPGTLILTYSQEMPFREARSAGIIPAQRHYQVARLHASQFIAELGPSAPDPEIV